jgi:MinD superfamily P-loop ATPase
MRVPLSAQNDKRQIIAVASGKGGTGKTTVATNLAWVAAAERRDVWYLDCDVEEPNGHLFLKPQIERSEPVTLAVPEVDVEKCTLCGQCGEICQYSAIVCIGQKVLTFPGLCHACGGCWLVCPEGAIREVAREVGVVEQGRAGKVDFVHGRLRIGEARAMPAIRAVKQHIPEKGFVILDAPPGTSCPVIETIRGSDLVLLVTEPTPFGLHDLQLAVETVRQLDLPLSVVINRSDVGDARVRNWCLDEGIEILAEIPDDRRVAEAYSRGEIIAENLPSYRETIAALYGCLAEHLDVDRVGPKSAGRRKS